MDLAASLAQQPSEGDQQIEDFAVGSLRVGQVRVDVDGSDAGVARLLAFLEPKLIRAGG